MKGLSSWSAYFFLQIYMFGNESKFNREIKTNASATSAVVQHLVRGMNYRVQLVAYNRLGDSVKSKPLFLGRPQPLTHTLLTSKCKPRASQLNFESVLQARMTLTNTALWASRGSLEPWSGSLGAPCGLPSASSASGSTGSVEVARSFIRMESWVVSVSCQGFFHCWVHLPLFFCFILSVPVHKSEDPSRLVLFCLHPDVVSLLCCVNFIIVHKLCYM